MPFGFNTNKGEYRCSALGELQPSWREGSRVETANVRHVSSFNLGIHPPPFSDKEFEGLITDPREGCKVCQQQSLGRKWADHQTKWHWQVHCKSFSFSSQKKDISVAQHGRISRGREYSHHVLQVMDLTHLRCGPNAKSNLTCPKLSPW